MKKFSSIFCLFILFVTSVALGSGASHQDPVTPVLIGLVALFAGAKLGGYLAIKLGQPVVLGELLAGVIIGNMTLFGFGGLEFIRETEVFSIFASIGVILLLFEVGLESSLAEMLKVGFVATVVAIIGVILPFFLGYGVSSLFYPEKASYIHAFIGATLCATSVGITARVLKDLGKTQSKESKIILGAAVIDDVLGLIVLAVVSGVIASVSVGSAKVEISSILMITFKAVGFLVGALLIGTKIAPAFFRFGAKLRLEGMLITLSLSFCFITAYLASLFGLAPIVGAFAAGLIVDGSGVSRLFGSNERSIEDLFLPLSNFFVPIFFVHMGMQVKLNTFTDLNVLAFGFALTFVAILGKQACGLGVFGKDYRGVNKFAVGIGMIPRGEVGLIFAMIGSKLFIDSIAVIDNSMYSAIVIMVMITTMITPPALKRSLQRIESVPVDGEVTSVSSGSST